MIMEQTKRRRSFLVILNAFMAFALLSTDICSTHFCPRATR